MRLSSSSTGALKAAAAVGRLGVRLAAPPGSVRSPSRAQAWRRVGRRIQAYPADGAPRSAATRAARSTSDRCGLSVVEGDGPAMRTI